MTCWLNACRSAISVDASSSRAPADAGASASEPLSSATAKKPNEVEGDRVLRDTERRQPSAGGASHGSGRYARSVVLRQHQADVEHRAQRRHLQRRRAGTGRARRDDRQHVERREVAGDAAGEVDERRDDQRVDRELQVDQPADSARRSAASPRRRRSARRSARSGRRTDRSGTHPGAADLRQRSPSRAAWCRRSARTAISQASLPTADHASAHRARVIRSPGSQIHWLTARSAC